MVAPAPPVLLRWVPQRADFDDAIGVFRRRQGGITLVFPHLGAVLLVLIGAAMLAVDELIPAGAAAAGALLLAVFGVRMTNRALWNNPLLRNPQEAVVGVGGLRVSGPNGTTDWRWSAFERAVETPRSFVLIGAKAGPKKVSPLFCYLPKAAAPQPAEVDRLRALLGSVLPGGVRPR